MRFVPLLQRLALTVTSVIALTTGTLAQSADTWPEKPVKLILNFAPGGGIDNGTRPYTEPLQRALGQPFVLEHKAGASGVIGISGDFMTRNRAASCRLVPMISGTAWVLPARATFTG